MAAYMDSSTPGHTNSHEKQFHTQEYPVPTVVLSPIASHFPTYDDWESSENESPPKSPVSSVNRTGLAHCGSAFGHGHGHSKTLSSQGFDTKKLIPPQPTLSPRHMVIDAEVPDQDSVPPLEPSRAQSTSPRSSTSSDNVPWLSNSVAHVLASEPPVSAFSFESKDASEQDDGYSSGSASPHNEMFRQIGIMLPLPPSSLSAAPRKPAAEQQAVSVKDGIEERPALTTIRRPRSVTRPAALDIPKQEPTNDFLPVRAPPPTPDNYNQVYPQHMKRPDAPTNWFTKLSAASGTSVSNSTPCKPSPTVGAKLQSRMREILRHEGGRQTKKKDQIVKKNSVRGRKKLRDNLKNASTYIRRTKKAPTVTLIGPATLTGKLEGNIEELRRIAADWKVQQSVAELDNTPLKPRLSISRKQSVSRKYSVVSRKLSTRLKPPEARESRTMDNERSWFTDDSSDEDEDGEMDDMFVCQTALCPRACNKRIVVTEKERKRRSRTLPTTFKFDDNYVAPVGRKKLSLIQAEDGKRVSLVVENKLARKGSIQGPRSKNRVITLDNVSFEMLGPARTDSMASTAASSSGASTPSSVGSPMVKQEPVSVHTYKPYRPPPAPVKEAVSSAPSQHEQKQFRQGQKVIPTVTKLNLARQTETHFDYGCEQVSSTRVLYDIDGPNSAPPIPPQQNPLSLPPLHPAPSLAPLQPLPRPPSLTQLPVSPCQVRAAPGPGYLQTRKEPLPKPLRIQLGGQKQQTHTEEGLSPGFVFPTPPGGTPAKYQQFQRSKTDGEVDPPAEENDQLSPLPKIGDGQNPARQSSLPVPLTSNSQKSVDDISNKTNSITTTTTGKKPPPASLNLSSMNFSFLKVPYNPTSPGLPASPKSPQNIPGGSNPTTPGSGKILYSLNEDSFPTTSPSPFPQPTSRPRKNSLKSLLSPQQVDSPPLVKYLAVPPLSSMQNCILHLPYTIPRLSGMGVMEKEHRMKLKKAGLMKSSSWGVGLGKKPKPETCGWCNRKVAVGGNGGGSVGGGYGGMVTFAGGEAELWVCVEAGCPLEVCGVCARNAVAKEVKKEVRGEGGREKKAGWEVV